MEYGKALNEYADYIWEAFEADDADETEWSAYQFEYPEDEFPVFAAYVTKDGGEWVADLDYADWAPIRRPHFPTKYAAMEWCASWAWCPEVGQGERTAPKWACPNEECSRLYGEHPAILDGDEEHGWTCPKCGCSTNFPEADGCYYIGRE